MNIVIDENIPFAEEAFSHLGSVSVLPGRHITRESLGDVTALIVRSVTRVNEKLLAGTGIRFVGTATAGIDHIDFEYLSQQQISFADAAGCNANSVAEYILTALATVAARFSFSLEGRSLGIVGVGRIGQLVANIARGLGMEVILNDPPLQRKTGNTCYRPLDEILKADIVTLHVPLTKEGIDKTLHLIGEKELAKLSPSSVLINVSRGEVVNNLALLEGLKNGSLQGAVLDVWEKEPSINWELVNRVTIATPHIAGYSFQGKINGTRMMYRSACEFFGVTPIWEIPPETTRITRFPYTIETAGLKFQSVVHRLATRLYDLAGDDARLRSLLSQPVCDRSAGFDKLRKNYPARHEFFTSSVGLKNASHSLVSKLNHLGFSAYPIDI